jgi:hypothetical protein
MSSVRTDFRDDDVISVGSGHHGSIDIDFGKAIGVEQPVAVAREGR